MVSVDTVYQRVLALANKEQRGYITPQEYNLLANQSQMEIFEEYFHHLNQYLRNPGNNSSFSDSVDYIEDKISRFEVHDRSIPVYTTPKPTDQNQNATQTIGGHVLPSDLEMYRLTNVRTSSGAAAQQTTRKKYQTQTRGTYSARIHDNSPVYIRSFGPNSLGVSQPSTLFPNSDNYIEVYDNAGLVSSAINIDYIRMPKKVNWDYVVVNEKALYNANGATDFDLHPSEETNLVYRILTLSGITINKPGLASLAKAEFVEQSNNEKS